MRDEHLIELLETQISISQQLLETEIQLMATTQQLSDDATKLAALVSTLISQLGSGQIAPADQANIDAADTTLQSSIATAEAAVTPPAPAA